MQLLEPSHEPLLTKEFLEQKYLIEKLSIAQIAKMLKTRSERISKQLQYYRIPYRRQYDDLTGKTFDKLTVVEFSHLRKDRAAMWMCLCECGNKVIVKGRSLKTGDNKSCGCKRKTAYYGISGDHWHSIKRNARLRNLKFSLSIEFVWNLFLAQDKRCAISGVLLTLSAISKERTTNTASLDRIDSSKGYIEGNVQWVHKSVNVMKMDMSEQDFFDWIDKIYSYHHNGEFLH